MSTSAITPLSISPSGQGDEVQTPSLHQKDNDKVPWSPEIWQAIHRNVHDQTLKVQVGANFLPHRLVHPKTTIVNADQITFKQLDGSLGSYTLVSDEGSSYRMLEIPVEFAMTTQHVHETSVATNPEHTIAFTLAGRAAMHLAKAVDLVIHQGKAAYSNPSFTGSVRSSSALVPPLDGGLLSLDGTGPFVSSNTPVQVHPLTKGSGTYGEKTLTGLTQGIAALTLAGYSGPYAFVVDTAIYADTHAAVGNGSLVMTADRIVPLVTAGYFGTNAVRPVTPPDGTSFHGVLVATGGRPVDLTIGLPPTTAFIQQDPSQLWRFRVVQRFLHRVLDNSGFVRIDFMTE